VNPLLLLAVPGIVFTVVMAIGWVVDKYLNRDQD